MNPSSDGSGALQRVYVEPKSIAVRSALVVTMLAVATVFCCACVLMLRVSDEEALIHALHADARPGYALDGVLLLCPIVEAFLLWLLLRKRVILLDSGSRELVVRTAGLTGLGQGQRHSVAGVAAVQVVREQVSRRMMGANIDTDPWRWHVRLLFDSREPERLAVFTQDNLAIGMAEAIAVSLGVEVRHKDQPLASPFD